MRHWWGAEDLTCGATGPPPLPPGGPQWLPPAPVVLGGGCGRQIQPPNWQAAGPQTCLGAFGGGGEDAGDFFLVLVSLLLPAVLLLLRHALSAQLSLLHNGPIVGSRGLTVLLSDPLRLSPDTLHSSSKSPFSPPLNACAPSSPSTQRASTSVEVGSGPLAGDCFIAAKERRVNVSPRIWALPASPCANGISLAISLSLLLNLV